MDTYDLHSPQRPGKNMTSPPDAAADLADTAFPRSLPDRTTKTRHPAAGSHATQITVGDGALRIDRAGSKLHLAGDIDEFTHAGLLAALSSLSSEPGDIHIDLSDVDFCDVAGLRALMVLSRTRPPGDDDHDSRVILHRLPPHLTALLQILDWDCVPGLVVAE